MRGLDTYTIFNMNNNPDIISVDLAVITDHTLSDGAKTLYAYIHGIESNEEFEELSIIKALGLSVKDFKKRKKELQDADLLLISKDAINNEVMYIGNSREKASESKHIQDLLNNK